MLEAGDALEIVLRNINKITAEGVSVFEALGRVAAGPVRARRDLPPNANSAMDGYALISADTSAAPVKLKVKGVIAAGDRAAELSVEKGTCYRIMTGAFMPHGADAVIQHELTDNGTDWVMVNKLVEPGFCVRGKGEDMTAGSLVDRTGERITPYHIGRYVSAGVFYIPVYRKPRIALISTGNEIADPGEQDDPTKIFDSNGPMLKAFLNETGAEVSYLGVTPDSEEALLKTFSQLEGFDMAVTSAGISAGDFDYMKLIADKLGIKWEFDTVNQKPGMHMSFGLMGKLPVFACPGNPVSAMFCAYYYIKPALKKMLGMKDYGNIPVKVRLGAPVFKKKGRAQFDRVRIEVKDGVMTAYPFETQDSHRIESLVAADAFALFDNSMAGEITAGTEIYAYIFNSERALG